MSQTHDMQFYLKRRLTETELIELLEHCLATTVETLDRPDDAATAFLLITAYREGFAIGASVRWRAGFAPKHNHLTVARCLAQRAATPVATDLPPHHAFSKDPYIWLVVEPDGTLYSIAEETSASTTRDGLVLRESSRRPIESKQL